MTSDTAIDYTGIGALRAQLKGTLLLPGDDQYREASQPWNLHILQGPTLVVMAASAQDIQVAVKFANYHNMGVGVMATGHGVGSPCYGGVLINTSRMRGVAVDPVLKMARVEAGALWSDVIAAAKVHGLATLAGSAPHVGVVGYTLGGGFGYLGRKYGLSAAGVIAADVVMADGTLLHAGAGKHEDLLWAVKGGGGNFGVVTALAFKLYPLDIVYGGAVFYPIEQGQEALAVYAQWMNQAPDEITSAFVFMNFPEVPAIPETLRGRSVVIIKGCYCGENPGRGEALFKPVRMLAKPIADTFGVMPVAAMDAIGKDPVEPTGSLQYAGLLTDLSPEAIDALVNVAGAGSGSPLTMVEIRKLGGALAHQHGAINILTGSAQFSFNALGPTLTPVMVAQVQKHMAKFAKATRPYETGDVFLNFLEAEPTPERVRSAYTPEAWQRLVTLKKRYDAKNIFRFNRNIPPGTAS